MFTGIISEVGKIKGIKRKGAFSTIEILCPKTLERSVLGGSVSVNGVCLTVTAKGSFLSFDIVLNTLAITNLKRLKIGDNVNLENALKVGEDLSGHIVSGHVDGERKVKRNFKGPSGWVFEVSKLTNDKELVVTKSSVAVDGVSLTVAEDFIDFFRIYLVPYTLHDTTLSLRQVGDYVNVEYDVMGKYVSNKSQRGSVTEEKLRRRGFM